MIVVHAVIAVIDDDMAVWIADINGSRYCGSVVCSTAGASGR